MKIVANLGEMPHSTHEGAVCLFVDRGDSDAVGQCLERVGLRKSDQAQIGLGVVHPGVRANGSHIIVTLFGLGSDAELTTWVLVLVDQVLLVIGAEAGRDAVLSGVQRAADEPRAAIGGAILGLARSVTDRLAELADEAREMDTPSRGFSRADERAEIRLRRGRLFTMQECFAAQAQLVDADEELAGLLGEGSAAALRRARSVFVYGRATSARLYALAGDVLTEQSALVNERLTLVSTFFLPLTFSTGFFGMNFGWMTDHVGGLASFVVLGIAVPVLTTLVTLHVVRRLGASGS